MYFEKAVKTLDLDDQDTRKGKLCLKSHLLKCENGKK